MRKIFNIEQETFIRENYLKLSDTEIAKELGNNFTQAQVTGWRHNNGLNRERRITNIFSEDDINFIKLNYDKMSYSEIGEKLGYTERQIRGKINGLGLTKLRKFNNRYFKKIDTSLKAYFLGFIFADGWVIFNKEARNYEFGIQLQSKDKYILEKINEELGGIHLITHINPQITNIMGKDAHSGHIDKLRVFSKPLVLDLIKNGIETNKTQKNTCPQISDEFFFDFMRGYIDGDGCFWKMKNNYYMHITSASKEVLLYLQKRLKSFNIETKIYKETEKKYRLMCINKKDMMKLVNKLYPDSEVFCLKRKKDKIKEYLIGSAA